MSAPGMPRLDWLAGEGGPLRGELSVPGDKSVSHRAVMLGALAQGTTRVTGFLEGEDTRATAAVLMATLSAPERKAWCTSSMERMPPPTVMGM